MPDAQAGAAVSERLLSLRTALGPDALEAVSFRAEEALSAPYQVTVQAISSQSAIDPDNLLFRPACVTISFGAERTRVVHGLVRRFEAVGAPERDRYTYALTLVPRLWYMGQTSDCRIFTNKSAADILTAVCGEMGQTLELKIYGDRPAKPYVTQYNETDFAFISRLIAEAGYFYYFKHTDTDHTLVVTDENQGFPQDDKPAMTVAHEGGGADVLTSWRKIGMTREGMYWLRDYDPEQPAVKPEGKQATTLRTAGGTQRDVFEWPALAPAAAEAADRARLRMEGAEADAELFEAAGQDCRLGPGSRFTLSQDPFDTERGVEYIVRSVGSQGHDESWLAGNTAAAFANRIVAFKASVKWRERQVTPRPRMSGVHSAVVLGNDGEEIHADKYGRVKVRFFWDHREDATADTACWVRVVQPWAGNSWGWQHLPRVGTEVAVAFLDGDPDRPVVMGGLYNGEMMPVFAVPNEQTKSGFRSRSTPNGSTSAFSELSFDDKSGEEKVLLHAERDLAVEVENDETVTVGNDRKLTVKHQETIEVDDSQTVTVKNGRTTTIKAAGDTLTVEAGGITETAKQGDISVQASTGSIKLQALTSIELSVGANKITIDNQGVTISALQIKLQGQAMVQVQAPMTQMTADGMMMLKGGIMMLN